MKLSIHSFTTNCRLPMHAVGCNPPQAACAHGRWEAATWLCEVATSRNSEEEQDAWKQAFAATATQGGGVRLLQALQARGATELELDSILEGGLVPAMDWAAQELRAASCMPQVGICFVQVVLAVSVSPVVNFVGG